MAVFFRGFFTEYQRYQHTMCMYELTDDIRRDFGMSNTYRVSLHPVFCSRTDDSYPKSRLFTKRKQNGITSLNKFFD